MTEHARVAIITGSSSGVGAATARTLARSGWNVVVNYARSADAAQQVAEECRELGGEALIVRADVAVDADCRSLVAQTLERWGRIDLLVNNAGTTKFCDHADLEGLSAEDFLHLYAVNTVGPFQMTRAAVPALRASGRASVVNVASIAGLSGVGSSIAYAASKGALITMTKSLARALGPEIRVNAVCPGFIQGRWLEEGLGADRYAKLKAGVEAVASLGVCATPEDVADTISWLGDSRHIVTGETVIVDGGAHLGKR